VELSLKEVLKKTNFLAPTPSLDLSEIPPGIDRLGIYIAHSAEFIQVLDWCLMNDVHPLIMANAQPSSQRFLLDQGYSLYIDGVFRCGTGVSSVPTGDISFMTSGSTSLPQIIEKSSAALIKEADYWASYFADDFSLVVASVGHQHIYGFIFACLVAPLLRVPVSPQRIVSLEELSMLCMKHPGLLFISSPSFLSRVGACDEVIPSGATMTISSGGPLHRKDAEAARKLLGCPILEVFGSTETGAIAIRRQSEGEEFWSSLGELTPLDQPERFCFSAPWCESQALGDRIDLQESGEFSLLGRADNIFKINEKRVSEQLLLEQATSFAGVDDARVWQLDGELKLLLISRCPKLLLQYQDAPRELTNQLRRHLMEVVDYASTPKSLRVMQQLPVDARNKTTQELARLIFDREQRLPRVVAYDYLSDDHRKFQLVFNSRLPWYRGHFDEQPIFPGVGTTWVVAEMSKRWFAQDFIFTDMSAVKYQTLLKPGTIATLELINRPEKQLIQFSLCCGDEVFASGKIKWILNDE